MVGAWRRSQFTVKVYNSFRRFSCDVLKFRSYCANHLCVGLGVCARACGCARARVCVCVCGSHRCTGLEMYVCVCGRGGAGGSIKNFLTVLFKVETTFVLIAFASC